MNTSSGNLMFVLLALLCGLGVACIVFACGLTVAVAWSARSRIAVVWRANVQSVAVKLRFLLPWLLFSIPFCSQITSPMKPPREMRKLVYKKKVILGTFPDHPAWINILNRVRVKEELHEKP